MMGSMVTRQNTNARSVAKMMQPSVQPVLHKRLRETKMRTKDHEMHVLGTYPPFPFVSSRSIRFDVRWGGAIFDAGVGRCRPTARPRATEGYCDCLSPPLSRAKQRSHRSEFHLRRAQLRRRWIQKYYNYRSIATPGCRTAASRAPAKNATARFGLYGKGRSRLQRKSHTYIPRKHSWMRRYRS